MKKLLTMVLLFATLLTALSVVSCGGEKAQAKVVEIDLEAQKIGLSIRALIAPAAAEEEAPVEEEAPAAEEAPEAIEAPEADAE